MSHFAAHPLTPTRFNDLVTVFGGGDGKGDCGRCWCMWWRLPRLELGAGHAKGYKALFKARVDEGPPPGLVGYDASGAAVGWVQVGPRSHVPTWSDPRRVTAPLDPEDAGNPAIWGISCFVVRVGFRRRGHFEALLDAAIDWARQNRATALDACPVETTDRKPSTALFHGLAPAFAARGFTELARRRPDRPLVRLVLAP